MLRKVAVIGIVAIIAVVAYVVMGDGPGHRTKITGRYTYLQTEWVGGYPPGEGPLAAELTLREDGSYRLCQPACGEGRFALQKVEPDEGHDRISFDGPMKAFVIRAMPTHAPLADTYPVELSLLYSLNGTREIYLDEGKEFWRRCFLPGLCR